MAMFWLCCGCCYGCRASQERINISAVPMAPQVSFQTLNSCFTYLGFNSVDSVNRETTGITNRMRAIQYPKTTETLIQKDTCTQMFTAALFTITKMWK